MPPTVVQSVHAPPPVPHAVSPSAVWHVPPLSQQPEAQVWPLHAEPSADPFAAPPLDPELLAPLVYPPPEALLVVAVEPSSPLPGPDPLVELLPSSLVPA